MTIYKTHANEHTYYARYLYPYQWNKGLERTWAVGLVYYVPIEIPKLLTIDGIIVQHVGVAAGNLYVAFYDSVSEAPVNRLAVSASTAVNGTIRKQRIPFTALLQIIRGYYFLAFEVDNALDTYYDGIGNVYLTRPAGVADGPSYYYQNLGSYGIPPAAATPVQSDDADKVPLLTLRVSSIP
jgi:hypothetical protein